jgi:hypothetical protein
VCSISVMTKSTTLRGREGRHHCSSPARPIDPHSTSMR